jgi:hypothetical protein
MALPFGGPGYSEGLVVRFDPDTGESWVGNFQRGLSQFEGVLDHPNGKYAIVLSGGAGYVVDPVTRELVHTLAHGIQHFIELPHLQAIVFSEGVDFEAINRDGIWWTSPRISWDGFRDIRLAGTVLRGEAFSPLHNNGDGIWVPFTLDLMTGRCEDGVYEREMRNAIPVRAR